jgi:2-polyprenyl-3-methyl-5-hydroxy-6-metoxy-1,4-benzoquinol methylase
MRPRKMAIAVLFPRTDHPAIEERYATWQSQMRLRRGADHVRLEFYDPHESAADVVADLAEPHILVVTDPLVVPSYHVGTRLRDALETSQAAAAVPVANEAHNPAQHRVPPDAYLTLRELESVFERLEGEPQPVTRVTWDESNPHIFLCRRETLAGERAQLRRALRGRDVAVDPSTYVHVWSPMRAQVRDDLLLYIPLDAHSLLELGCGEGGLGALVKQRQKCRVVGIEIDHEASAIARKKIDDVYTGDVRHIIEILHEKFDCVVASEIVEHVDDPWSLLSELREVTSPGGALVISIPNLANASVVGDLIAGRFDYTYVGLACAGHLRFFTRASIEDLLDICGWKLEAIVPQHAVITPQGRELIETLKLDDKSDLLATGFYVVARNA